MAFEAKKVQSSVGSALSNHALPAIKVVRALPMIAPKTIVPPNVQLLHPVEPLLHPNVQQFEAYIQQLGAQSEQYQYAGAPVMSARKVAYFGMHPYAYSNQYYAAKPLFLGSKPCGSSWSSTQGCRLTVCCATCIPMPVQVWVGTRTMNSN